MKKIAAMSLVRVISGRHMGKIGWVTKTDRAGNVMFYPLEEETPRQICLSSSCVASFKRSK